MRRTLISTNERLFTQIIGTFTGYLPYLKAVKNQFESSTGFDLTPETWKLIRNGNIEQLKVDVLEQVNQQLDKANMFNRLLRAQSIEIFQNSFPSFELAVERLYTYQPTSDYRSIQISEIEYANGQFFIAEQTKENLKEQYCRVYLDEDDPEAMELYKYAQDIANAASALKQKLLAEGLFVRKDRDEWILNFISFLSDTEYGPNVEIINENANAIRKKRAAA